jgi:hypothetical protein
MKHRAISILATLSLFVTGAVAATYAGSGTLSVNIPFSFVVDSKTLPPGRYEVSQTRPNGVVLIRSADSTEALFTPLTTPIRAGMDRHRTEMQFHKYGNAYFLSQVWISTDGDGCELPKSKLERELIKYRSDQLSKAGVEPELVAIAAH